MLTEEEASKKWCPFARMVGALDSDCGSDFPRNEGVLSGWNRRSDHLGGTPAPRCVASQCAAWRWGQKPNPDWKQPSFGFQMGMPWPDPRTEPPLYVADETRGYCGLAGRP